MHNGQLKPNLRCRRKALSGLEGLLEIVGLVVMPEGTHSESWRSRRHHRHIAVDWAHSMGP